MKSYLLVIVLLLFYLSAGAQTAQTPKIVYLKDGSNIKGTVTINDSAGYVMVVDVYNEPHYFQKNMVAKIDEATHRRNYTLKPKGYVCNIEMGGTEIIGRYSGAGIPTFSFNVINSYLISPYTSIGMGIGTELTSINNEMLALYVNYRIYFIKSDISPFFELSVGYNAMFANGYYGDQFPVNTTSHGMIANPGFGIRVAASKKVSLTASIGYKLYYFRNSNDFNHVYFSYNYSDLFTENADRAYSTGNALALKLGFQF